MPGEAAGFQQIARRVEVCFRAELEVLLGAAGDERGKMEYGVDCRCDERARELRVGDVADERIRERHRRLVGCEYVLGTKSAHQCGTDVARRSGDEYSHGRSYSINRRTW